MGFIKKIFQTKKTQPPKPTNTKTDLLEREREHRSNCSEEYYFSDEAKIIGKQLYQDKKEYMKQNPEDFEIIGAHLHKTTWNAVETLPPWERKIFQLTGAGKYYEDQEEYEKAIELYQQAEEITRMYLGSEINQMIEEYGESDYLHLAPIRRRIRVCKRKLK